LFNDPDQFLNHYYHFVAELLLGTWAFWSGTFSPSTFSANTLSRSTSYSTTNTCGPPPIHRAIFAHSTAEGWRDGPGFNSYFLRAAFPSVTIEVEQDWNDRIITTPPSLTNPRAWHFPVLLLADRSAAFRGQACGHRTQRTAAEAHEAMVATGRLRLDWWEPVRQAVLQFAGGVVNHNTIVAKELDAIEKDTPDVLPMPERVVITYISRQSSKRHLISEDHDGLVAALEDLVDRKGWGLNVVQAERLTKDEQVRVMGETTVCCVFCYFRYYLAHLLLDPTRGTR